MLALDARRPASAAAVTATSTPDRVGMFKLIEPDSWQLFPIQRLILRRATMLAAADPTFLSHSLCPLITQEVGVSLRALDWLCTNYSQRHALTLRGRSVHASYKAKLRAYKRRFFDPFQRCVSGNTGRLSFVFEGNGVEYCTTVGQVNFMAWAHTTGIIRWIQSNINAVEKDMASRMKPILKASDKEDASTTDRGVSITSMRP